MAAVSWRRLRQPRRKESLWLKSISTPCRSSAGIIPGAIAIPDSMRAISRQPIRLDLSLHIDVALRGQVVEIIECHDSSYDEIVVHERRFGVEEAEIGREREPCADEDMYDVKCSHCVLLLEVGISVIGISQGSCEYSWFTLKRNRVKWHRPEPGVDHTGVEGASLLVRLSNSSGWLIIVTEEKWVSRNK